MADVLTKEGGKKFPAIYLLVFCSGMAALSWNVIWQIRSSLALGVSAWGTALTLAVTMGGMCIGSLTAGFFLKNRNKVNALRVYGVLEIFIGVSGLFLMPALDLVERIDTQTYRTMTEGHYWVHIFGIAMATGFPAICMGATTPVFGLAARQHDSSISTLYGLNTLGAALGSIMAAFIIIPLLGVLGTTHFIAAINIFVGVFAVMTGKTMASAAAQWTKENAPPVTGSSFKPWQEYLLVFVTGFSTLALEVAWFRSFTAAFWSTTAAFSVMLSSVLLSLGLAAKLVPLMRLKGYSLSVCMTLAGISILLATPIIERFDLLAHTNSNMPAIQFMNWFALSFLVTSVPITVIGLGLPWILDNQYSAKRWGILYGVNTISSVLGSIMAAWVLLPSIGFTRTSWIIGVAVASIGLILTTPELNKLKLKLLLSAILALGIAVVFESGVGRTRVQIHVKEAPDNIVSIVASTEGPDATVTVVEFSKNRERALVIDGFIATSQPPKKMESALSTQYMLWMGHLPMLLHPDPKKALVICFGTGQTANAVRRENPQSLTIVDINKNVFSMADYFTSNEAVLKDPRVTAKVMDGRAFLRRTDQVFDVITLEPMPPTFAGVNALYSREFYQLARQKMTDKGIIAQWLPFHLVSSYHSASISRTFNEVFPNSVMWIDPQSLTGILLGSKDDKGSLGKDFPGFKRNRIQRILPEEKVPHAVYLERNGLKSYGEEGGEIITDDNQLLAYGLANFDIHSNILELIKDNYDTLKAFKEKFYKQKQDSSIENFEKLEEQINKAGTGQ
ncbi:MAG: fused MFS/spermidine synthase [Alphaproteobacteria bacterium]|nr:fused MFS/spermidine synthase [Alphaproteobacteria bacterium]